MDILTPHEGLTNEQISEAQIELFEKKQTDYRLIGQIRKVAGHTLFKYNRVTGEVGPASYKVSYDMVLNPRTGLLEKVTRTEVLVEKDCYYEQALNLKNFVKRLRRRGIIGVNDPVHVGSR